MINKINLESFKAFGAPVEFLLEGQDGSKGKNLLAYGENGSGKSSLYEALRLFFYEDRLLQGVTKEGEAQEKAEANRASFLRGYNNQKVKKNFTLKINDQTRDAFPLDKHACYMLCNHDVQLGETLKGIDYLQDCTLPPFDVNGFWKNNLDKLIRNVNNAIKEDFKEQFTIEIADIYSTIKIVDNIRGVSPENHYRQFLNEAKLHLVALLLYFETVKLHKATLSADIDKVMVLDDIVTSLDATNRIFLVNYLIKNFSDCQLMILTHNVSFFNLVHFKVSKAVNDEAAKWMEYNICETGEQSHAYHYNFVTNSGQIRAEFEHDHDGEAAGNKIRKRFEAVLYEYAKLIQIDPLEESNQILTRLVDKNRNVYVKKHDGKIFCSNELIDEIIDILAGTKNEAEKVTDITTAIDTYKNNAELDKVVEVLKEMKMFQKVVLHQLSHGNVQRPTFSQKEVISSLALLGKLENLVEGFKEKNAYGF